MLGELHFQLAFVYGVREVAFRCSSCEARVPELCVKEAACSFSVSVLSTLVQAPMLWMHGLSFQFSVLLGSVRAHVCVCCVWLLWLPRHPFCSGLLHWLP